MVMSQEPIPEITPDEIREYYAEKQTEQDLADAFAITSNKFFWVADNEYDYEEGSLEHRVARQITDAWGALMDEYEDKIFSILINEGVEIPERAQIRVLKPFMARNGYRDGNGWWIKKAY